jgi:hypothetical protein
MNYVCLASQDKQSGALARKSQQLLAFVRKKVRHSKPELKLKFGTQKPILQ